MDAALVALGRLSNADVAKLAGNVITPQTVGNIRRDDGLAKRRLPETTVLAFEAAAKALEAERAA